MSKNNIKLKDLIPDDKNFNVGSEYGNQLIEKSLRTFDSKDLAPYVGYSRTFIYKLISKKGLPFHNDEKGIIYFLKDEIDLWLIENKKGRGVSVITECSTCRKEYLLHNYRVGKAKKSYCSIKCRKTAKIISCDWCKKEIIRIPAGIKKHNFCSTSCMGKYQTKNYSGENSKHWVGDYQKYYGSDWNHQRNAARERDNFECQFCGINETVRQHDVHHKKAFATFGIERHIEANELNNLITLCNSCHSKIEPKRTKGVKNKNEQQKIEIEKAAQEKAERMAARAKIEEEELRKKAEAKRAIEEEERKQEAIKQALEEERARQAAIKEPEVREEESFEDILERATAPKVVKVYEIIGTEEEVLKAVKYVKENYEVEITEEV